MIENNPSSMSQLSMLGVMRKLRGGDVQELQEVQCIPGCINRSYKFVCAERSFFVKINDRLTAGEMFEGESGGLKVRFAFLSLLLLDAP